MITHYHSPIGWLELKASAKALQAINFLENEPTEKLSSSSPILEQAVTQLTDYFRGDLLRFSVPMEPQGSAFQRSVWERLQKIPYGQTTTYGKLAHSLGDPNKVRAVGNANGQNPIPIIVPCHRVIGANNSLVGYAGGISRKRYLLQHEGAILL